MAIPLHLAVHLLGLAVAAGLVAVATMRPSTGSSVPRSVRSGVVVGGALLAASHVAVGALLASPDGWPLVLRAAGYAALAVGAAGGLTGAVAAVALVPPLPALAAGVAGAAAALAAARGGLGRGRAVAPLVVGIVLWAVADLLVGPQPGLAGLLSMVGSLTAGTWVVRRVATRSLAGRVAGTYLAVLLALVVGLGSASGLVLTADVRAEQLDRLAAVADAQAGDLVDRSGARLEATASALAGATIVAPLEAGDHAQAARAAGRITALPGIDLVVLTDADGGVVGATGRQGDLAAAAGLAVAGSEAADVALGGELARDVVDLGDGQLAVVGAVPVTPTDAEGRPLPLRQAGALVLGQLVTAPAVVERIAVETASDAAVIVGGEVVASTFPADAQPALAEVVSGGDGFAELPDGPRVVAASELGEPARGRLVLALAPSIVAEAGDTALRTTFLLAVAGLLVAGAVATALARRITGPVAELTAAAERVAAGDLDPRVAVDRVDEVGRLAEAFSGMVVALDARDHELRSSLETQRSLRDRLEAVTASMGEALVATDPAGVVLTANPAAGRLLDRPVGELVGRPLTQVLSGRADGGVPLAPALLQVDGPVQLRAELDGSGRLVEATAAPLVAGHGDPGRVVVLRDITERVLADRVRTEVIANLSHELNTPLTPVKAFLELVAAHDGVEPRFVPMLELAREGRTRLERSITALIDLAELEAGKREVTLRPVPVAPLVDEVVERWRARLGDRALIRRVDRGIPPLWTDPATVQRILDELLDNARKFGVGSIRLLVRRVGDEAHVTVRDDGPGLAGERPEEVLELFVQADGSTTRPVGGLGIGLSIAARLGTLVGGRLEFDTPRGGGLDVTLVLPVADREVAP